MRARLVPLFLAALVGCEPAPTSTPDATSDRAPTDVLPTDLAVPDIAPDAAAADALPTDAAAPPDADCRVTLSATPVNNPAWAVVGAAMYVGTVGTPSAKVEGMRELQRVLAPNHRFYRADGYFGPGTAHAGPFDRELDGLLAAQGLTSTACLTTADLTAPRGVWLLLVVAPREGAPVGSAPDGMNLPIVPDARFPFGIDMDLLYGSSVFDPDFDSAYPGPRGVNPPYEVDGWSHFVLAFGDNDAWVGGRTFAAGRYTWRMTLLDAGRAGWRVTLPMEVR